MRINEKKEDLLSRIAKIEADLLDIIKNAEQTIDPEENIDSVVTFEGLNGDYYAFAQRIDGMIHKSFLCNPDDLEFYDMCIKKAIDLDKIEKLRARRLKKDEPVKPKNKATELSNAISFTEIDKAIAKLSAKGDVYNEPGA